jgi:hypothetical protein
MPPLNKKKTASLVEEEIEKRAATATHFEH